MNQPPSRKTSVLTTGVIAAVCAGCLDLGLSLWLERPAGLRSSRHLLLTLTTSVAIFLALWLAAWTVLRRLRKPAPRPLALALSGCLLAGTLLRSLFFTLTPDGAPVGPATLLLAGLSVVIGVLIYHLTRLREGGGAPLPVGGSAMGEGTGVRSLGALLLLALPLFLLLRLPASSKPHSSQKPAVPRVLLLSIDTLRPDALSSFGGREIRTPHLDALAGDSLSFTRAYSSASWTLPAMGSVMTGVSPRVHGALHTRSRVPDGLPTLAETLRRAGYRTAAFVASTVLGPPANLTQGFDEYHPYPGPWLGRSLGATVLRGRLSRFRLDEAPPPELTDDVADWLGARSETPFFLWVHFFDPHAPYGPPPRYLENPEGRTRFEGWDEEAIRAGTWVPTAAERDRIRQLYLGEVRWVDDAVGRLLGELRRRKLYDDTLIVLVSDHGEEFWEHDSYGHGHTLYDELLHVPLLVKLPRSERIGRIATPASTASIFSTVLDACSLPLPPGYPAAGSLLRPAGDRPLHALGLNRFEDRQAVRFGRFKYIRWTTSGREEIYDLQRDPREKENLAASSPADLAEGRRLLAGFEAEGRKGRQLLRLTEGETTELDAHTL
ncbi:MAG TPA: sulfatase, partial [Thermoanaerobaculia bacterium]|nr:sulfatase [Thermoanaerobaculia bacterium]